MAGLPSVDVPLVLRTGPPAALALDDGSGPGGGDWAMVSGEASCRLTGKAARLVDASGHPAAPAAPAELIVSAEGTVGVRLATAASEGAPAGKRKSTERLPSELPPSERPPAERPAAALRVPVAATGVAALGDVEVFAWPGAFAARPGEARRDAVPARISFALAGAQPTPPCLRGDCAERVLRSKAHATVPSSFVRLWFVPVGLRV